MGDAAVQTEPRKPNAPNGYKSVDRQQSQQSQHSQQSAPSKSPSPEGQLASEVRSPPKAVLDPIVSSANNAGAVTPLANLQDVPEKSGSPTNEKSGSPTNEKSGSPTNEKSG